ncbi:hypothetical protein AGMMS49940_20010 [Spirochaetia bacterium]|nr:hypothetical protein AGMMS49940_20010 [Spirochaetia bacterium]
MTKQMQWSSIGAAPLAIALAAALALAGCTEGPGANLINLNKTPDGGVDTGTTTGGGGYGGGSIPVASVTAVPKTFAMEVGDTSTLSAAVLPTNATNPTMVWKSDNTLVATVDEESGELTGVAAGTAVITVTAGGKSDTCTVTVGPSASSSVLPGFTTLSGGYTGSARITYMSGATLSVTVTASGTLEHAPSLTAPTGAVKSITLTKPGAGQTHLIGRDSSPIVLSLTTGGELKLRPAGADGNVPIGSYAEFQLISTNPAITAQNYKQEANLDLMGGEPNVPDWTPVGTSTQPFGGIYDGGGKKLTRLTITTTNNNVGLFGVVGSGGKVKNLGIASGTVSGGNNVGGVAGVNNGTITACYNAAKVTGGMNVGGIAGSARTITACYNTGMVNGSGGNIGGVAGLNQGSISACYNTGTVGGSSPSGGVAGFSSGGSMDACYFIDTTSGVTVGGGATSFTGSFTPEGSSDWGPVSRGGGGGEPGQYWQSGTTDGTQLPRLWFES